MTQVSGVSSSAYPLGHASLLAALLLSEDSVHLQGIGLAWCDSVRSASGPLIIIYNP